MSFCVIRAGLAPTPGLPGVYHPKGAVGEGFWEGGDMAGTQEAVTKNSETHEQQ